MIEDFEQENSELNFTGNWNRTQDTAYSGNYSYGFSLDAYGKQTYTTQFSAFCNNISFQYKSRGYWAPRLNSGTYAYLTIYIDDIEQVKQTEDTDWTLFSKKVSLGDHTVKLVYTLINDGHFGTIYAYIDLINISVPKFFIKQNNKYYSIKDNIITELGISTDDTQKEQWFNNWGVDDLKVALLTPDENGKKLIDSLDDKFEIRMMVLKD